MKKHRRFTHLDAYQRDRIEALLDAGETQKEIAKILKVDPSTISREIHGRKRKNGRYDADTAAHKAGVKRSYSKYRGMKIEGNPALKKKIISMLTEYRSPDEIAGRLSKDMNIRLGKNAVYKWLYSAFGQRYCGFLCTKRRKTRRHKNTAKREMIPHRVHISKRPRQYGLIHTEGDTAVSPKKSGSKHAAAFITEISSKLLLGARTNNLKPSVVSKAMEHEVAKLNADTLTLDNGIENKNHEAIGLPTFFCDPHAPWQKPHIETNIGLLRRWFVPKGTDWRTISDKTLQRYLHRINSKYRKSLHYQSSYEVAYEKGILKTLPEGVAFR